MPDLLWGLAEDCHTAFEERFRNDFPVIQEIIGLRVRICLGTQLLRVLDRPLDIWQRWMCIEVKFTKQSFRLKVRHKSWWQWQCFVFDLHVYCTMAITTTLTLNRRLDRVFCRSGNYILVWADCF